MATTSTSINTIMQDIPYPTSAEEVLTDPPRTQWKPLEGFEREEGNIWMRAEGNVACFPAANLVKNSEAMHALEVVRKRVGMDGTKEDPMFWPSVRADELRVFAAWLIKHDYPTSFEEIWGLLKVAHLLQVPAAYSVALRSCKELKIDRWQKLAISARYPVWHWLPGIINYLILDHSLDNIRTEHALAMGF
ncbi:hypothetical protein PQX77_010068 [Marasmius sp. AFHP31]|nr:hypothetical protein PQX77_010068 [Marasmius sp. AFHP31]